MAPSADQAPDDQVEVALGGGSARGGRSAKRRLYQRVTLYLTHEQKEWLADITRQAVIDGVPISNSDLVRLAIDDLREDPRDVCERVLEHARAEVVRYPGRAKRGRLQRPG